VTVYLLERDGELLARMPLRSAETFAFQCDFEPLPAFEPFRLLFDEDARLAGEVATNTDPALLTRAEALLDRILALGFTVRREGGGLSREVLIGVEDHTAHFRPLTPEEEPL
jgi:hypothetical protein